LAIFSGSFPNRKTKANTGIAKKKSVVMVPVTLTPLAAVLEIPAYKFLFFDED